MIAPTGKLGVYVVSILVIVLALGGGWWAATLQPDTRPGLTAALDSLPARTNAVGFTDWAGIRSTFDFDTVDTAAERDALENEPAARDLTTRSVIGPETEVLHDVLGWSAADAEWEVYGQDPRGAAGVIRLDGSVSAGTMRDKLRAAGYEQKGEVWSSTKRTGLSGFVGHVALVPREQLVVISDSAAQIRLVLDVIGGRARSLAADQAAAATAQSLAGSDSVILQGGTLGCESTAVTGDADRVQQARTAVRRAGDLQSYRYSGRGLTDRGGSGFSAQQLVFAMTFDSGVTASEQVRVRSRLTEGPFIGRIGRTDETLRLRSAGHRGPTVRLAFAHDPETTVFMTGAGPVLFATCRA